MEIKSFSMFLQQGKGKNVPVTHLPVYFWSHLFVSASGRAFMMRPMVAPKNTGKNIIKSINIGYLFFQSPAPPPLRKVSATYYTNKN
jgi:hypothetical protein